MKKYLIRVVSTATEKNRTFSGDTVESYHGKGNRGLSMVHRNKDGDRIFYERKLCLPYEAVEYGYDKLSDARRNWSYRNPQNDEFWTSSVEIVEYEV